MSPNDPLFAPLTEALTRSNLPDQPQSVLRGILWALEQWSKLDARVDVDRPDLVAEPDRRRAYRLGLAEKALMTVHSELNRLAPPPRPSSDGPKAF